MAFDKANLSRLRTQRHVTRRSIARLQWRIDNDPGADLVRLSELADVKRERLARIDVRIEREVDAEYRRIMRQIAVTT